jgi:hypothetical protein
MRSLHCELPLPVDIVLSPAWWFKNCSLTFDSDFFFNPFKRVEAEQTMEHVLYERWGKYGLGKRHDKKLPEIGAVHLASGFLISEMMGCRVEYKENDAPQVIPAFAEDLFTDEEEAFRSPVYKKFSVLSDHLEKKFGWLSGDVNWGGILNIALDLRGQELFMDMVEKPDQVNDFFSTIKNIIARFVAGIEKKTGSSSVSVNRNVIHIKEPVFLHSECSHTMISVDHYEQFLFPFDAWWSKTHRPFGIHYCGPDPHRYAESFARLPHLDFLDVGWGGDLKILRKYLPHTFMNIRLSPVTLLDQTEEEIRNMIRRLVKDSGDPNLTGVCCINMDDQVSDGQITAIFETVNELRNELTFGKIQ